MFLFPYRIIREKYQRHVPRADFSDGASLISDIDSVAVEGPTQFPTESTDDWQIDFSWHEVTRLIQVNC